MLQLKNHSPLAPAIALFPNPDGVDTLYIAVKATFRIGTRPGAPLTLADEQLPPFPKDVHWGEPGESSIRYASELHPSKPGTDVALVGAAHAPGGRPVTQLDVALSVAGRRKVVRVFGDRVWKAGLLSVRPTDPVPFTSIPLIWEKAFGGVRLEDPDQPASVATNPVGLGLRGPRSTRDFVGEPVPNLEDPKRPLKAPAKTAAEHIPQGFGFIASHWQPRVGFAGTYDDAWQKGRAPYLPVDFDPRFFHAAHPDLVFEPHLKGGEPVEVLHASPGGALRFELPTVRPECKVDLAGAEQRPEFQLESVVIEPDEDRVCLLWRAALPCDKKALEVRQIDVFASGDLVAVGGAS